MLVLGGVLVIAPFFPYCKRVLEEAPKCLMSKKMDLYF